MISLYRRFCDFPRFLRPLLYIDFRDDGEFEDGYQRLLAALRDEPLPRQLPAAAAISVAAPAISTSTNLPRALTPLVDREEEVKMVRALLLLEGVHLLTLVGPGGLGKTRVALEVAGGLVDQFRDGVFFVALGAIRDPNLVASAIAQTVSIGEFGGLSLVETLKAALRNKQLLLLLDTFDHLIEAAPLVTELLAACPQLKLLVTSRMVLRVRGENRFAVLPLTVPDPS